MEKVCFAIRLIAVTMGLTACSGINPEVVAKDVELLEEVAEDVVEYMQPDTKDAPPVKKKKRRFHPRMNDKLINLNYEVSQRSSLSLV